MKLSTKSLIGNPWGNQNPNPGEIAASALALLGLKVNLSLRPQTWVARVRLRASRIGIVTKDLEFRSSPYKILQWPLQATWLEHQMWFQTLFVNVGCSFHTLKTPKSIHNRRYRTRRLGKSHWQDYCFIIEGGQRPWDFPPRWKPVLASWTGIWVL